MLATSYISHDASPPVAYVRVNGDVTPTDANIHQLIDLIDELESIDFQATVIVDLANNTPVVPYLKYMPTLFKRMASKTNTLIVSYEVWVPESVSSYVETLKTMASLVISTTKPILIKSIR